MEQRVSRRQSPPHVVHEGVEVIRLGDRNLERVMAGDVARQAGQALLTGASDSDEEHVAPGHAQDT